ncbi:hypothetical protein HMI55_007376 [Coelomomyces lativittatus]|nr:hypothetical protein HMI56_002430 [Coelomomyces lativittatus]KAJ1509453.1 hypothetical protein HMI55_007376 [Coelomomyces lativittatus]
MANTAFYIRYKDNQPVKIETHYAGENKRRRPLTDVADLIGTFFPSVAPADLGSYSLHSVVDGVESTALCPGLSLIDLAIRHTSDNPLIIKSQNDLEVLKGAEQLMTEKEKQIQQQITSFWKSLPSLVPKEDILTFTIIPPFFPKKIKALFIHQSYANLF